LKVLVDCVPLTVGGGVQVAIGLLAGLKGQSGVLWGAVVPRAMRPALPPALAEDRRITFVNRRFQPDRVWLTPLLHEIERGVAPDVVFTVFGPSFFRPYAPHLVGFAMPHLIYDREADMPAQTLVGRTGDRLRCLLFRQADHLVVETAAARARLAARLAIDLARISVIPNSPNPLLSRLPDEPVTPGGPFVILIPGAYYAHKNLEIVPTVAAAMRRLAPNLRFVFRFTLPVEAPEWRRIRADAERQGVGDRLATLGIVRITDLARAYRDASAVYLPTLREVSTAVYPESFLFRRPLVTTDMDFAHDLCGEAALLVPPRDAGVTAARLVELAGSPQLAARLITAGERQLAAGYPTPEGKFNMQLELIAKVAEAGSQKARSAKEAGPPGKRRPAVAGAAKGAAVHFHDEIASVWDAKYQSGGFRKRAQFFATQVLPEITGTGHWLDAGCGSGYFSRLLAARGQTVIGIDASVNMIEAAQRAVAGTDLGETLRFEVVPTVERLPFADASFDGALCLSVLEYLDRPGDCLDELARVIKPGRMLLISLPHRLAPIRLTQRAVFSRLRVIAPTKWEYAMLSRYASTARGLSGTLAAHGFALRKIKRFDPLFPSTMLNVVPSSLLFGVAVRLR
jgi:SAM-dependent methyltransferase/glycosyltransferase involved in cell wall biosynthesis